MKFLARFILWAALALALVIGLVEAGLWFFAPVEKRAGLRWQFDNQLPGVKEQVAFSVDGRSLRSWNAAAPSGSAATRDLRILVLGGGASMAILQNNEDTWWGQLGAALQSEFPDTRIHVSALVREYGTSLQAAKWAEQHLEAVNPDVVIVALGFEDVLSKDGAYRYTPDALASLSLEPNRRNPVKEFLVNSSQICRRAVHRGQRRSLMAKLGPLGERNAYAQRLAQARQLYAQLPLAYEVDRSGDRDPLPEYLDGLRAIATLCQKQGAALAVIGEPTLHRGVMDGGAERLVHRWFLLDPAKGANGAVRLDSGWIELQLSRYYGEAEKLCASLGVPFLDPLRKLPANPLVFVDDVALTDSGAKVFAKLATPLVQPLVARRLSP